MTLLVNTGPNDWVRRRGVLIETFSNLYQGPPATELYAHSRMPRLLGHS